MTFIQPAFLVLLAIVLVLYWGVPNRRWQNLVLLVSSAVFYGWVHPWFLWLIYGSALLDYTMGHLMVRRPERRRLWLTFSLMGNLGLLGYFKYADFFLENVAAALTALDVPHDVRTLGIFLPVGISFYTFQTMSYTLDIFRGKLEPRRDILDYLVFVSFFPQLVAGPVERASDLLPQMETPRSVTADDVRGGVSLALWGAFKKVCIADVIAPYVNKVFALQEPAWPLVTLATVGFAIQILADFSGYTDIARGVARLMGFKLSQNFDHPYLSVDPSDFWRRWHISFSTWIRDYLYIPLGGNRGGFWGTVRSTYGAMLLSGLWHGASWNFVLWGGYHATLITGYRLVTPRLPAAVRGQPWSYAASVAVMFFFTCIGWLLFRETSLTRLIQYVQLSPFSTPRAAWISATGLLSAVLVCALPLVVGLWWERGPAVRIAATRWRWPVETSLWALGIVFILAFYRDSGNDFIYFQF